MDPYRLPRTVVPSRYDLRLEPDLANDTFAGRRRLEVLKIKTILIGRKEGGRPPRRRPR